MDEKPQIHSIRVALQDAETNRLARDIARVIDGSGRFRPGQLHVSARQGTVTLRGNVASYYHKQVAQSAALTMLGTRRLVNEIEVR